MYNISMLHFISWLLFAFLYFPTIFKLYTGVWDLRDYTHAYFILPLSIFMVWTKCQQLISLYKERCESRLSLYSPYLLLILFGFMSFLFGWRQEYLFITTFSMIPLTAGLVGYLYGSKVLKICVFPINYLILLVPLPMSVLDSMTLPLRYFGSYASAAILTALNYDVTRHGLLLNMGGHEIFMGAPCSGFRSLITMISLGLVYIYFRKAKRSNSMILFMSIFPLAILGNLVRILILCFITYYFGEAIGQGFFHYFSGAVVFFVMICGLMGIEKMLNVRTVIK